MPKKPIPKNPTLTPRKKSSVKTQISLAIDFDLLALIAERGENRSEVIRRDGLRYYRLLADARRALRERFSGPEISLIIDACNGWWILSPEDCRSVDHNIEDAIRLDGLDQKWNVPDSADLVARLRGLTWLEAVALCDAIERFWHAASEGDHARDPARALD